MRNVIIQIIFAITVVIVLLQSSCSGALTGPDTTIEDNSPEKQLTLRRLHVEREGIKQDDYYLYSVSCWKSAMDSLARDYSIEGAKNQLIKFCPSADISSDNTQIQTQHVNMYTCSLVIIPRDDLKCN